MRRTILTMFTVFLFVVVASGLAVAATGGGYNLSWFSIDGGGGVSSGGMYTVNGTIGQPDTGTLSGGDYHLQGGFWPDPVQRDQEEEVVRLYLPVVR